MCLSKLLPIPDEYQDDDKEHIGYKIFRKIKIAPHTNFPVVAYQSPIYFNCFYTLCKWIKDSTSGYIGIEPSISHNSNNVSDSPPIYESGFHIFLNKEDAEKWMNGNFIYKNDVGIKMVKFKQVLAYGIQTSAYAHYQYYDCLKCIVAKEMFIMGDDNEF